MTSTTDTLEAVIAKTPFYPTPEEFGGRIFGHVRLVECEDGGTYVALGHIAPAQMLSALQRILIEDGVADEFWLSTEQIPEFRHQFGKFTHTGSKYDWYCEFTVQDVNTTPITIWTV